MYILANGVKITEKMHQRLCQAIKDDSRNYAYFLDIETGKLIRISPVQCRKLTAIKEKSQRFILLPKVSKNERRKRFAAFVEELGVIDFPELQNRLSKEIKKGASIDKLEQILKNDPSGWIHGWVQDEQFLLAERIEEWITKPPLNARDDPDYWFFDDCAACQATKFAQEDGRMPTQAKLREAFKKAKEKGAIVGGELFEKGRGENERKWMKERGFEYIGKADNFKMPKWTECTWRRVPCGKWTCKVCGRIQQDRLQHTLKGEDPDSMESIFADVGKNLKEALQMIKKDAKERGIDITNIDDIQEPPEPEKFPFYRKVSQWHKGLTKILHGAEARREFWLATEAAADILWYKNTLLAKTYRQLCNRWEIDRGDEYGEFDYNYTKYILEECLKILKPALKELSGLDTTSQKSLRRALAHLVKLEKETMSL